MLTLNQTLKYKSNIQEKRNILLTVKDVSRHKHAVQIDEIQTADASTNILTIQVRELQNLIQSKKKKSISVDSLFPGQSWSKASMQTLYEGKSASPGMGRVPANFSFCFRYQ